jgi:hypothetical protein
VFGVLLSLAERLYPLVRCARSLALTRQTKDLEDDVSPPISQAKWYRVAWIALFSRAFHAAPILVVTSLVMLGDLLGTLIGMVVDHTTITGMPAWDKPTKFALSTGMYALSLAVIISYTPIWRRLLKAVDILTGLALTLEVVLIDIQAYRHTTSHFNDSTPLDAHIYRIMGIGIGLLWLSAIAATVATLVYRYEDNVWKIVVRGGMILIVFGSSTGGLMVYPSRAQLAQKAVTHHMPTVGSHTVGAPDGGAGMPLLGWSTEHGDIRTAHFIGLHGLQVLALWALFLRRRGAVLTRTYPLMLSGLILYAALFGVSLFQALIGEPIIHPDKIVLFAYSLIAIATIVVFRLAGRSSASNSTSIQDKVTL